MNLIGSASQQYKLLQGSRKVLLDFCAGLSPEHFIAVPDGLGDRSIKDILIHAADIYIFWLTHVATQKSLPFTEADKVTTVEDIRQIFLNADQQVQHFLETFRETWTDEITRTIPSRKIDVTVTPLEVFTHVLTHEFHHKGQILIIARKFGYVPPDTDAIRF